ncbi:MAG: SRPBCC family protein [Acidobacteriota bacterium]|nr:SRPBCC family protein [Acidobacteriota bacterium]MDH3786426.1 SRPBCC family protein [Acidobacteriota bacterium]
MSFTVSAQSRLSPEELVEEILDVRNWPGFTGWGPLPGIDSATIIEQTSSRVGTRIAVTNSDGSTHEESVTGYVPDRELVMKIENFSTPLKNFARYFVETWQFDRREGVTRIERTFELHAKGLIGQLILVPVGFLLRRAVAAHTKIIAAAGGH